MSIWSSVNPEVSVDGNCFVDVATAMSWNDRVRVAIVSDDYVTIELTVEQTKQLIVNLSTAIDRIEGHGREG